MKPLAESAIKALKDGQITFYPSSKKDQLIKYLEGLKDWNISRQIAWGIPIPAFVNTDDPDDWIFNERVGEETLKVGTKTYRRDPDVFDTWFSSSSWPYATLNYPEGEEFSKYYPLSVMETGGEILYPWVSRMIMLGLYVTGKVPFEKVYIHGYVMAEDGSKMSKSVGNVIDLNEEISKYGSDAMRMGIIAGRVPAVNRGYDSRKVQEARNFCNKLWNIARFIQEKVGEDYTHNNDVSPQTNADHWILTKLQHLTEGFSGDLDNYRFAEGYEKLYHFIWDELADWYIEASKQEPNNSLLAYVLETTLKLIHPFAPFVSEAIWQTLGWQKNTMLVTQSWPKVSGGDKNKSTMFENIKKLVSEIRHLSTELHLKKPHLYYNESDFLNDNGEIIKRLGKVEGIKQVDDGHGLPLIEVPDEAWLDVENETIKQYVVRLKTRLEEQGSSIKLLESRLKNKAYVDNAPREVVDQTKSELKLALELQTKLLGDYNRFSKLT